MNHVCEICGETHDESEHGEAIVVLEQCTRNIQEYTDDVISEVASLASQGLADFEAIQKVAREWGGLSEADCQEYASEFANEALACLKVPYLETGNDLLIFNK